MMMMLMMMLVHNLNAPTRPRAVQNDTPPVKALEMTLIHRITTEPVSNFAVVRPTTCIFKDWFLRPFLYR